MKIIKRSGLLIPKTYQYDDFYIKIKEFLERRTKIYNTSIYSINRFYIESEKFLLIPRNFPIQTYLSDYNIVNHQHDGKIIDISHNITPRSLPQQKAIEYMLANESSILQLDPGVGKTVITIYMIAERKRKSLILVHRDSLADQWRDRFLQFTTCKNDDIARLRGKSFNKDLDHSIIISTTQTFLSLLKRNREDFLRDLDKANIGIFVADEIHTTVGAPTFSECSIHIPSKYTYGLSATPYRYDGNEDIIKFHLGEIFSDDDLKGTLDAKITVMLLDYKIDTPFRHRYIRWEEQFQRSRYLNLIKKSKPFVDAIRGLLVQLKERDLICIAERIKLIDELYNWMPSSSKSKFCGTANLKELKSKITFATPGKCRDGIDAPWKDTLIMTSPISNIVQLAGRINRQHPNKKTPIIVDMVDYGCPEIRSTFYKREKFYDEKQWPIQYLLFAKNKLSVIDREITHKILRGE